MNKIILALISVVAALFPVAGHASGLVPYLCNMDDNSCVYRPISYISYHFDCFVGVTENSVGTVYCENQPVVTGFLEATKGGVPKGRVNIIFDSPLLLPKGKTYTLVVPADAIYLEDDPSVTNDELSVQFYVPENIGAYIPTVEEGSVVYREDGIYFEFGTRIAEEANGEVFLYRKDVPIKKYPCYAYCRDFSGLGGIDFHRQVHFESGVEYTVRLPKGCVYSRFRSDITNEEATVSFLGGCPGDVQPLVYTGCSLSDRQPSDVLGEVRFYYDLPVTLCLTPSVQLYNGTDGVVAKEVVPTLAKEEDRFVMTVDFENAPLAAGKEYSIIIPEATVVLVRSDILVNQRNTVPIVNNSGVSEIGDTDCEINVENGSVTIDGASAGAPVTLLSLDGKVLYNAKSNGGMVSIPVGTTGIYLLSVNGKTHKIAVSK